MKALVGAFNQEKALVGAFSVIVQPVVEPMEHYTALTLSTRITFAPKSERIMPHTGAGASPANSITFKPFRAIYDLSWLVSVSRFSQLLVECVWLMYSFTLAMNWYHCLSLNFFQFHDVVVLSALNFGIINSWLGRSHLKRASRQRLKSSFST